MDEPIIYRSGASPPVRKPPQCLYDKLQNALMLDDKDEFLKMINDPGFEPMQQYHRNSHLFLRQVNVDMILTNDAPQIAIALLNGETRGIIDDDDLVFKDGWTPLHLASATPSPKLIKYLIQRGHPVDVPCDYYAPLNLRQATPLDLALEVIDTGYVKGFNTIKRPWTPSSSIFELFEYVCEWQKSGLEVVRLLVQNTKDKERVRKAFFDYAYEGKLVKLTALLLAAPELFSSPSLGGGSMSSIDTLYLNLKSLEKTTDIQDGLSLLLDVFNLVGHMLIAYLRVDDLKVWELSSYANQYKIGFFLRKASHKKLGILSRDDYLLRFFKPVSHVYRPPSSDPRTVQVDTCVENEWNILPSFEMERKNIDIGFVNSMIPSLKRQEAVDLRNAIENKLSIMPNICTLFEGMGRKPTEVGKQWSSFPCARSVEATRARSFCTEAATVKRRLDFKVIPGNGWESRVMNPTKLESFFSAVRLSHFPVIARRLIK